MRDGISGLDFYMHIMHIICMTTVLRFHDLKYKINERDHNPPHVHVEGRGASVRINLITLEVMDDSTDFSLSTLRKIVIYVATHREELYEKWIECHEEN